LIASIVVPAKGETITLSFNDKVLIKVDLPAFGLPIIEIFGELPSSVSEIFSAMFDFKYFFKTYFYSNIKSLK